MSIILQIPSTKTACPNSGAGCLSLKCQWARGIIGMKEHDVVNRNINGFAILSDSGAVALSDEPLL